MPKRSRNRSSARRSVRREFSKPTIEYTLTDAYTPHRVTLWHPIRLLQLLRNGRAERTGPTSARLHPKFALVSDALADNGEPQLRSMAVDTIWPRNDGCPTGSICERLWLHSGASFSLEAAEIALAVRREAIEGETLLWGLPVATPRRLAEDWGAFGAIEYA